MKLNFKFKLDIIIVLVATLLALILINPLFSPGIPANIDSSCHYLREWCLQKDSAVPNNWCNYWQAGVPSSQYYYPPIDYLTHLLSMVFGLEFAYKLILTLALFMPAIGSYVFLRSRGKHTAAAFAYALLLLHKGTWHIGGFEETILVGMWPYIMTTGFWILCMGLFLKFIEKPTNKNLFWAVIFTPFLSHPITLLISLMSYIVLSLWKYKEIQKHWRVYLRLIGFGMLVNAYYWIPFIAKRDYFPKELGGGLDWFNFKTYLLAGIPWWIWIISVLGIITIVYFKDKENYPTAAIYAFIAAMVALNFIKGPIHNYFAGLRIGGYLAIVTYTAAAVFLGQLMNLKINNSKKIGQTIAITVFLVTAYSLYATTHQASKSILLSDQPYFQTQKEAYDVLKQLPDARVLAEETLYNFGNYPQSFTHSPCLVPVYSNKEVIGSGLVIFPKDNLVKDATWSSTRGKIFNLDPTPENEKSIWLLLNKYNVKYVIAHSSAFVNYFVNRSVGYKQINPFIIFDTGIKPSFFAINNGKITAEQYEGTYAKATIETATKATVILKTNFYANWKAYVNGKSVKPYYCSGLMCVDTNESGIVEFKYGLILVDWLGYIVTIIGIYYLIQMVKKK